MNNENESKKTFAEKHPTINTIIGVVLLLILLGIAVLIIYSLVRYSGLLLKELAKLDAVVIVALITGGVSIVSVVLSSIVGKHIEYKKSRNEYLAQKREDPYCDFVELIYKVQKYSKDETSYTQEEMVEDLAKFSKQLTMWGSPKVAKKWNEFRQNSTDPEKALNSLWITEEIMNEMRKDLGTKKIPKGGLLGFFIDDIDKITK